MQTNGHSEHQGWCPWWASRWSSQSSSNLWLLGSESQASNHRVRWQPILMEDLRQLKAAGKGITFLFIILLPVGQKIISTLYLVLLILIRVDLVDNREEADAAPPDKHDISSHCWQIYQRRGGVRGRGLTSALAWVAFARILCSVLFVPVFCHVNIHFLQTIKIYTIYR